MRFTRRKIDCSCWTNNKRSIYFTFFSGNIKKTKNKKNRRALLWSCGVERIYLFHFQSPWRIYIDAALNLSVRNFYFYFLITTRDYAMTRPNCKAKKLLTRQNSYRAVITIFPAKKQQTSVPTFDVEKKNNTYVSVSCLCYTRSFFLSLLWAGWHLLIF